MPPTIEAPRVLQALYGAALRNLLDTNVTADGFIRAGGGYAEPWTRDAAINCWHAASLLAPDTARATLLKVCETRPDGSQVISFTLSIQKTVPSVAKVQPGFNAWVAT